MLTISKLPNNASINWNQHPKEVNVQLGASAVAVPPTRRSVSPPRFLGVPVLAPGSESGIPLLMSVKKCNGKGCRVTYTGLLCTVSRAGAGAKRRRAKPVSLVGEVSRTGGWDSCAPCSDPWTGDHRPTGCGFAAARREFLAGWMAWWLRLEWGWHCQRALPDCKRWQLPSHDVIAL